MSNFLFLVVLAAIAVTCLCIALFMVATKRASNPHHILELAGKGNRLARAYVGLFVAAVAVFLVFLAKRLF